MSINTLRQLISEAPKTPGVYIFRDKKRRPLYIGKAVNIRARLSNYPRTKDTRIRTMVESAITIDFKTTETEIEALILESQLIKDRQPQFNIMLRDDKQYFYIAVTDSKFPQLILTHQFQNTKIKQPIKELIGPFTEGVSLKSTLRLLRNLLPYCTCKQRHHVRCLNAHIGKCPGFCCLKDSVTPEQEEQYAQNIHAITEILTGKRATLIKTLEKEMRNLGRIGQIDKAYELQKKIGRIKHVFQNAQINARNQELTTQTEALDALKKECRLQLLPRRIEGYDIANIQGQHATGSMVVFTNGIPDKNEYRKFNIKTVHGSNDVAMLKEVLTRRFNHPEWPVPDLIIVDGGKAQLNAVISILKNQKSDTSVIALTKNEKHRGDHLTMQSGGSFKTLELKKISG